MAISNVVRFGQDVVQGTPAFNDMWLPVYGGEVLTAFRESNVFAPRVNFKTMTQGQDMKFPATWKIGSEYHEAGTELLGLDIDTREYTISLDDRPLVSHFELDDIDQAMAHFEVRSEFAQQTGLELAKQLDIKIISLLANAAVAADTTSFPAGLSNGTNPFDNTALANPTDSAAYAILEELEDVAIEMDTQDVPSDGRACALPVAYWYALRNIGVPGANTDTQLPLFGRQEVGMQMNMAAKAPPTASLMYNGFEIFKTNHIPTADVTTGPAKYQHTFGTSLVKGIVWQRDAIAVLQLLGITTEQTRDVRRQSDFMVTKMLTGGGALRPNCAAILTA